MKEDVLNCISDALIALNIMDVLEGIHEIEIEIPRNETFGDMTTTVAMALAKRLKKNPFRIAEDIVSEINKLPTPFEDVEVAGQGFINFRFKKGYLYQKIEGLLESEGSLLKKDIGRGKRVQIEFVSANPTGPLHIGHGRGAAVGNALCNLLEAAGYDVQREYYINDAGAQVRLLGFSVYTAYQQLLGNLIISPEDGYKGMYVKEIAREIKEKAGERYLNVPFDECSDFFINYSYKRMLADISQDLRDLGVVFDRWQSERELYERQKVQKVLEELRDRGLAYEKDGAVWFSSSRFGDDKDRVIVKADGEYTYFASDIAYHKDKLDRGFDIIINLWGADHHGYIPRLKAFLNAFGLEEERFKVILIQMVTLYRGGKPVQMSKRSGEFITLREVLDEVGADIAKFIFLTRRADSQLDFDIDIARRESSENPVFYVQYAFARISSIFKEAMARVQGFGSSIEELDLSLLRQPEELSIIKKLLHYPMVFEGAVHAMEPHRITYYLQELASLFHSYYNRHRVISDDRPLTVARLFFCKAIHMVLQDGLNLLGVKAPERMERG